MACNKIAGYHDLYWMPAGEENSVSLGMTGPDGLDLSKEMFETPITGDAFGPDTLIDSIYQGANVTLSMTLQDVKLDIVKRFLNPFTEDEEPSTITGRPEAVGVVGRLACSVAGSLYAIPRANTPAASLNASGGSGRRFVGIASGPRNESLDTRPRFIPITFQAYPFYLVSTTRWVWWEWVSSAPVA